MDWEHEGFVVEEDKRPGSPINNQDQYYFLILKDDQKVFKYCVWLNRDTKISKDLGSEQDVLKYLREKGIDHVKAKIEAGDFANLCLLIDDQGEKEVLLDEIEEKLE